MVAVRADGKKAYASSGSTISNGLVAVIDAEKDTLITKINVGEAEKGCLATGIAIKPFWWFKH
jgi:DNA-binding beta-propeller fold protein YncE